MRRCITAAAFAALAFLAAPLCAGRLLVFAAASMSDSLKALGASYELRSGKKVDFNFGASNLLARQIAEGAPADLFISADDAKMDDLEGRGLIDQGTRRSVLSNTLVAVALKDSPLAVSQAAGLAGDTVGRLALADPRAVPAGVYAKEYLQSLGLWDKLSSKVIPTGNVRGALQAVESGNADAAMVYKTDALISKKVRVLFEVPAKEGPRIDYPFALVKGSANAASAKLFLRYLESADGLAVFKRYGFTKAAPAQAKGGLSLGVSVGGAYAAAVQ
jgi:molybdate transport system substrate-binding protein